MQLNNILNIQNKKIQLLCMYKLIKLKQFNTIQVLNINNL